METSTSRDDFRIAVRSAFLRKGTQQKFSLFALIVISIVFLFFEKIENKPLNSFRSIIKDTVYRISVLASSPIKGFSVTIDMIQDHVDLYSEYNLLKQENSELKKKVSETGYLSFENNQLRKLIDDQLDSVDNLTSSRVMIDKQSPYLNSFIINSGTNREIKNGLAVLDGNNFIGRIVDVNFFSSRVLLVTDLNSKIPVIIEPSGNHAILSGHGKKEPSLDYLPKDHSVKTDDKVYTSGKEGIFSPGIPIGQVKIEDSKIRVSLFSDLSQITFVNVKLESSNQKK